MKKRGFCFLNCIFSLTLLSGFPEGELTAVSLSLDPIANVEISAAEHHVDKVTGAKCTACKFVVDKLVEMIGTGATKVLRQSWSLLPMFSVDDSCCSLSCRRFKLNSHSVLQSCYIKVSCILCFCGLLVATLRKIPTNKRLKGTIFIMTKHNMRIFGVSPIFKLQNDT